MSDLKHKSIDELLRLKTYALTAIEKKQERISALTNEQNGLRQRVKWIDHYLFEKRQKHMTIEEISAALGHRVTLVSDKLEE
jgi:hypothetical protein